MSTFVQERYAEDSSGTAVASIAVTSNSAVTAGNLIVCGAKHEGATSSISVSDGTSTLAAGTYKANNVPDSFGQLNWLLSANGGGVKTYTATFGASRAFPSIMFWEYSGSGVWSLEGQNTGAGNSTAPNSGNVTTVGTDGVMFGLYGEDSTTFTSSEQINGVAADGSLRTSAGADPRNYTVGWRKAYSSGFTGAASATLGSAVNWLCCAAAFKVAPAGTPALASIDQTGFPRQPHRAQQQERIAA